MIMIKRPHKIKRMYLVSWKNLPKAVNDRPKIKKDTDIPKTKKRVCRRVVFLLYVMFPSLFIVFAFPAK